VITASAPGKLFLFGEYAVLEGHLALIAAVDRRVTVRFAADTTSVLRVSGSFFKSPIDLPLATLEATGPASRVIAGVLAARELGASISGGSLEIDSSPLFDGDRKLGFGSSAAVTVATYGAFHSGDPAKAFAACRAWHNKAQGTAGSGGDIAASLLGGLACLRGEAVSRVDWVPPTAVLFHPESASTPHFISNVKKLKAANLPVYQAHMATLGLLAERAQRAAQEHDANGWVSLVRAATTALEKFGDASDTQIVTPYQREISALCDKLGAASKPAGAGGGDVSIVSAADEATLHAAMSAISARGGQCERLRVAPHGLVRG
jgi:phosphomevalonate kinase